MSTIPLDKLIDKIKSTFDLDSEGTLSTLLHGEDSGGTKRKVYVDSEGRIQLGSDMDIGNVNLLDTTDTEIDPATEPTLSSIDTSIDVDLSTLLQTADQPLDVSDAEVDIDISSLTYGTLPVEQQTPVGVENTGGTQIDPATESTLGNVLKTSDLTYDADGNLKTNIRNLTPTDDEVTSKDDVFTNIAFGQDSVTTSGTAEALNGGTSQTVPKGANLKIKALSGNSGIVYVGDSTVGTGSGFELQSGEEVTLKVDDVANVYIDVGTDGDGVSWIVEQA